MPAQIRRPATALVGSGTADQVSVFPPVPVKLNEPETGVAPDPL